MQRLHGQLHDRQATIVVQDHQIADLQGALGARDTEVQRLHAELASLRAELRRSEVRGLTPLPPRVPLYAWFARAVSA